jgi:hypothetical protein
MYDYQHGYCHYFADIIINEIRTLIPKHSINYYLILAERVDDNNEVIDDVLIHVYIKVGEYLLDSDGFHKMNDANIRLQQWEDTEETQTPDDYSYNTWMEESKEIPSYFFNRYCKRSQVKKDIHDFISHPTFQEFITKLNNITS